MIVAVSGLLEIAFVQRHVLAALLLTASAFSRLSRFGQSLHCPH